MMIIDILHHKKWPSYFYLTWWCSITIDFCGVDDVVSMGFPQVVDPVLGRALMNFTACPAVNFNKKPLGFGRKTWENYGESPLNVKSDGRNEATLMVEKIMFIIQMPIDSEKIHQSWTKPIGWLSLSLDCCSDNCQNFGIQLDLA